MFEAAAAYGGGGGAPPGAGGAGGAPGGGGGAPGYQTGVVAVAFVQPVVARLIFGVPASLAPCAKSPVNFFFIPSAIFCL